MLKIEGHPHVTGVAPFTQLQGMLTAQGQVAGIMVSGIEPSYEKRFRLSKTIWWQVVSTALKRRIRHCTRQANDRRTGAWSKRQCHAGLA